MSDYASVTELKEDINLQDAPGKWTNTLQRCLDAAEDAINRFCNRLEGFIADDAASARYYTGSGGPVQRIDECAAVSGVAVKDGAGDDEDSYVAWTLGTVGTTTGADVFPASGDPERPDFNSTPYTFLVIGANGNYSHFTSGSFTTRGGFRPESTVTRGTPTVKIEARWGFALTVPSGIKTATLMQAARYFERFKGGMADTVGGPDSGQLMFRKVLDPEVEMLLVGGRYVKPAVGRQ